MNIIPHIVHLFYMEKIPFRGFIQCFSINTTNKTLTFLILYPLCCFFPQTSKCINNNSSHNINHDKNYNNIKQIIKDPSSKIKLRFFHTNTLIVIPESITTFWVM
mmetsp:Transcript_14479/g.2100  ORF Transcript_14479/g.2100 Transcript_14479/m.2100 type:complete len:105 (+) Transcript_14479:259-573(+)